MRKIRFPRPNCHKCTELTIREFGPILFSVVMPRHGKVDYRDEDFYCLEYEKFIRQIKNKLKCPYFKVSMKRQFIKQALANRFLRLP